MSAFEGPEPGAAPPRPAPPEHPRHGAPSAVYWYTDEAGAPLYAVCRFTLGEGEKTFLQGRVQASGKWAWNLKGTEPVLYNLPAVARHLSEGKREPLWFFEGEKDCEAAQLAEPGITATTVPMGTHKWRESYSEYLNGLRLAYVCADNDEPGRAGALDAAAALRKVGADVRVLLPALDYEKADVGDHLGEGYPLSALRPLEEEPLPEALPRFLTAGAFLALEEEHAPPLLGTQEDTVLTVGGFLLMVGEGGASKTTLTLDALAHLCSGTPWLGIPVPGPVRALFIENEGTRPKFRQKLAEKAEAWSGAPWLENVHVYTAPWAQFSLADEASRAELREYVQAHRIGLVAADPLDSLGLQGVGSPDDTREFMGWLKDCGLFKTTAFWILHHLAKGEQRSALQRISGAWGGHPDAVLLVAQDGTKRSRIQWVKMRWATPGGQEWLPAEAVHLAWEVEQRGYTKVAAAAGVTDEELGNRLGLYLEDNPESSTTAVKEGVKGDNARISGLLKTLSTTGQIVSTGTPARPKWKLAPGTTPASLRLALTEDTEIGFPPNLREAGEKPIEADMQW